MASAVSAELNSNRTLLMGMGIMNAVGKSAMTALAGGDSEEIVSAFVTGFAQGVTAGMLFCAVAAITVTSMAAVFSAVVAADSILLVVLAVRSVMDGDYMGALVYGAFAVVGIIFTYASLKSCGYISIKGKRGTEIIDIGPDFVPDGDTVQIGVNPNSLKPTKDLSTLNDCRMREAIKFAGNRPIIVDKSGNVLDGHHRLKYAILNDSAVDVSIGR